TLLIAIVGIPAGVGFAAIHPNHAGITGQWRPNVSITPPNLQRGLIGWWTFDGGKLIQNVTDSSPSGNNGRLINSTATSTVAGVVGQAENFAQGTGVGIPSTAYNALSSFTISAWVKPSANSTSDNNFISTRDSGNSGWSVSTRIAGSAIPTFTLQSVTEYGI